MTEQKTPFMVSALLVLGAWLSSSLFIGLLAKFCWQRWVLLGLFFLSAGAVLQWLGNKKLTGLWAEFARQACVSFALCGKCLLAVGFIDLLNKPPVWADCLFVGVLAAISYPFFTQSADRFVSVWAAGVAGVYCLQEYCRTPWLFQQSGVLLFAFSYALLLRRKAAFQPLAWGLLFAAPACLFFYYGASFWFIKLLLAGLLCAAYVFAVRRQSSVWVCLLIAALVFATNIGAGASLGLLALGQVQKRLMLKVLGIAAFAVSLFWLYFAMEVSLLVKSGYLCAAGLVLLCIYAWLKKGEKYAC